MRILFTAALIAGVAVPLAMSGVASAADLDYEYRAPPPYAYEPPPPPPRVYERHVYLPPPVGYERPIPRPRPYPFADRDPRGAYGDGYRPYRRPYAEAYEDFGYQRPRRPSFDYGPY